MKTSIVLTIIADDQPGIIELVSETLSHHGGNWTQSSMSSLAGQFAGILLAYVPIENTDACLAGLSELESRGLRITAHIGQAVVAKGKTCGHVLNLVGNDHPGIVHDITRVLAKHGVSVIKFETAVEAASMGGGELFKARVQLLIPQSSDTFELESDLEAIANDLMVEISFEK